jgi:dTMP kinase
MAKIKEPFFIALEGIDKCGKNHQRTSVELWLERRGVKVSVFDEPHDNTPIGARIRSILRGQILFPGNMEMQRLFTIDRAQGWYCFIKPELEFGRSCVIARYAYSTLAYGMAFGIDFEVLRNMQYEVTGPDFRWPDLTFLIDIMPEEALERAKVSNSAQEYFEKRETLARARDAYICLSSKEGIGTIHRINGMKSMNSVSEAIIETLNRELDL